jgi:hypothetical protein
MHRPVELLCIWGPHAAGIRSRVPHSSLVPGDNRSFLISRSRVVFENLIKGLYR